LDTASHVRELAEAPAGRSPTAFFEFVGQALASSDVDVRIAGCEAAARLS
jgi:hypothetical protein